MYVCICKNVTDKQVQQAICQGGACCMRDLNNQLGLGTECGKCGLHARELLRETLGLQSINNCSNAN